jgi:hypothetical protein
VFRLSHISCLVFFQKNVHSKAFVGYICDNVLPVISKLASPEDGVDSQQEMLKLFSEISEFAGDLEKLENRLENLYNCLVVSMLINLCTIGHVNSKTVLQM